MKGIRISEAIETLEEIKRNYGDVAIFIRTFDDDEYPVENIIITEKYEESVVEIS